MPVRDANVHSLASHDGVLGIYAMTGYLATTTPTILDYIGKEAIFYAVRMYWCLDGCGRDVRPGVARREFPDVKAKT